MTDSNIEWTDKTWNPVTGCTKVSPGCAHCYAEGVAERFWGKQYPKVEVETAKKGALCSDIHVRPRQFTDVRTHADRFDQPLRWRKPARIFVNSMSDLFHEDVSDAFIDQVFAVMALAPQHTFQVLTKRAERMRAYFEALSFEPERLEDAATDIAHDHLANTAALQWLADDAMWPLKNVWLGVSVENQQFADERIPLLLQTPTAVRFISAEPLLGPVNLRSVGTAICSDCRDVIAENAHTQPAPRLDWVIVGGESGPKARWGDGAWLRSIVEQCQAAAVPVFVKQLGTRPSLKNRKGADMAEWPENLRVRQFPRGAK